MRFAAAVLLINLVQPSAAGAQVPYDNFPVCLHVYGPVSGDNCSFMSIEQCRPLAQGISAMCLTNPWYKPPPGPSGTRRRTAPGRS
jgi:hypothetical protein